jgi:hypothetical protein
LTVATGTVERATLGAGGLMLTRDEVAELLALQANAYELLMWLGAAGANEPDLLSPEVVAILAASEGISLTEKAAGRIVKRSAVRQAALLWTYVWELDRRSRRKGKGPVVHRIWRSIPWETKKALGVERIWEARAQLLAASREAVGS